MACCRDSIKLDLILTSAGSGVDVMVFSWVKEGGCSAAFLSTVVCFGAALLAGDELFR